MLASLIQQYGYYAVFAGTFLEGETILVLAGFAAHEGYLALPTVIAVAFVASFFGDQFYFLLGRRYGDRLLSRFPRLTARAARVKQLLHRYHLPLILSIRFLYGLRIVGPMAIGMSGVSWLRFLVLNLIGAALWAALIAGAGYLFGQTLKLLMPDLKRYEGLVVAGLLAAGFFWWLLYRRREARRAP